MPTRSTLGQVGQLRQTGQGVKGETGGQGGVGQGIDEEKQEDGEEEKDHLSAAEHFDQHPSISLQLHAFTFYSRQASFTLLVLLNFNNSQLVSVQLTPGFTLLFLLSHRKVSVWVSRKLDYW